jgi:Tfp pilus assembly protein PilP
MKLTRAILAMVVMAGAVWAQNPRITNNGQHSANASQAAKPGAGAGAGRMHPPPVTMAAQPRRRLAPHRQVVLRPTIVVPTTVSKPVVAKAAGVTSPAAQSNDAVKPPKPEDKKWAMTGKRDPFFSPVVQAPTGSGCASGKKCLEIGQINVRGVVKSDAGYIAVVTNSLNKAYFLRENDPVFNGYVVRITGDTVVFQETVQDKLGKPMTREVVKRLFTPAV